ncbi:FAD-binding protein [Herbiconiux moechotypicola]|uniref:FAD-linked oxidase C-terminal domain-containing protein n=1 Tax=Herbiconiux moechotypicola TaxID=637393 RepID=A0ABN3D752_9MICO|nr:FAD-linked oxidase C-terminal domain-containing protein [Herbiconiux moechotypicola]MCS5728471.1 FAD-binding protein [Herbiconiux moechotypicola]
MTMTHDPRTSDEVLQLLRADLGDRVSTDPALLERVRSDKSGWRSDDAAICVVLAESVADVQATMRLAHEHGIPVVPRGAGSGLAGGATSSAGSVVLSLERMDRILEVSLDDELAVVEAGVINQALGDALAPHGYVYSPDPASKAISTIGGNIATNAGGLLCAKYGVTREAVLGLTVVLADGSLLTTGRRTVKGVTGYDLTALFTGSEGTLGVVVDATVRIRPVAVGDVVTIGAFFSSVADAAAACAAVTANRLRPAVMELMDAHSVAAVARMLGAAPKAPGAAYVLVQTDGAGARAEADAVVAVLESAGAQSLTATDDPVAGEAELAFRRSFHPALELEGEVLIEDVCVPRSKLAEMFAAIERISEAYGIPIPTVSHAGDGNLHPNFVLPRQEGASPEAPLVVPERVWQAADEMFAASVELGGTLTGEHGVGLLKKRWIENELGREGLELQRRIKAAFDPQGIMNPGKVY